MKRITRGISIKVSKGKPYHDIRLNADGAAIRPVRTARSSKGAPTRIIPSNAMRQEERTNSKAEATPPIPARSYSGMPNSNWINAINMLTPPIRAKDIDIGGLELTPLVNNINANDPPMTTTSDGQ